MRAFLFDFNGTMFFDESLQFQSWRQFILEKTGKAVSDRELRLHMHGINAKQVLEYFLETPLTPEEAAALAEEKEVIYRRLCLESPDFHLASGLPAFLDLLRERSIARTIATASPLQNVEFFFEELGLSRWFDLGKTVYDDGCIPGKPAPDIYLRAAERLGYRPGECIVLEDSHAGLLAARAAGAGAIVQILSMQETDRFEYADLAIADFTDPAPLLVLAERTSAAGEQ